MKRIYYTGKLPLEASLYAAHKVDCELGTNKLSAVLLLYALHKGGFIDASGIMEYQFNQMLDGFVEAHELAGEIIEKAHENDDTSESDGIAV